MSTIEGEIGGGGVWLDTYKGKGSEDGVLGPRGIVTQTSISKDCGIDTAVDELSSSRQGGIGSGSGVGECTM